MVHSQAAGVGCSSVSQLELGVVHSHSVRVGCSLQVNQHELGVVQMSVTRSRASLVSGALTRCGLYVGVVDEATGQGGHQLHRLHRQHLDLLWLVVAQGMAHRGHTRRGHIHRGLPLTSLMRRWVRLLWYEMRWVMLLWRWMWLLW